MLFILFIRSQTGAHSLPQLSLPRSELEAVGFFSLIPATAPSDPALQFQCSPTSVCRLYISYIYCFLSRYILCIWTFAIAPCQCFIKALHGANSLKDTNEGKTLHRKREESPMTSKRTNIELTDESLE